MPLTGLIQSNRVYLPAESVDLAATYLVAVGISRVQGYAPVSCYLNDDRLRMAVKFQPMPHDDSQWTIVTQTVAPEWTGVPLTVKVVELGHGSKGHRRDRKGHRHDRKGQRHWANRAVSFTMDQPFFIVDCAECL